MERDIFDASVKDSQISKSLFKETNSDFYLSSINYLEGCDFKFYCDCCFSTIFFRGSNFYIQDECMADLILCGGSFYQTDDSIFLESNGVLVSDIFNWEFDLDSSVSKTLVRDTISAPFKLSFLIDSCQHKIKLVGKKGSIAINKIPEDSIGFSLNEELLIRYESLLSQEGLIQ